MSRDLSPGGTYSRQESKRDVSGDRIKLVVDRVLYCRRQGEGENGDEMETGSWFDAAASNVDQSPEVSTFHFRIMRPTSFSFDAPKTEQ